MKNQKGFTLIELMVVLAIMGIVVTFAVPSYQQYVTKSARTEGTTELLDVMRSQENFFANNYTYTIVLTDMNYSAAHITSSGRYSITAARCVDLDLNQCVELRAQALGSQARDGNLTLNSQGTRSRGGVDGWN
jgi:prepilin-type N-terminal cleavage/methylation domain-containing protein